MRRERGGERRGRRRKVCDARLGEGQNAQLAGEDGGGSARTGRLQKARETAAAILNFGRSIEI